MDKKAIATFLMAAGLLVLFVALAAGSPALAQGPGVDSAAATLAAAQAQATRARWAADAQATSQALSAQATISAQARELQAQATRQVLFAQATATAGAQQASERATATAQAADAQATAQARSAQATATVQAYELALSESKRRADIGAVVLEVAAVIALAASALVIFRWAQRAGRSAPVVVIRSGAEARARGDASPVGQAFPALLVPGERMNEDVIVHTDQRAIDAALARWQKL